MVGSVVAVRGGRGARVRGGVLPLVVSGPLQHSIRFLQAPFIHSSPLHPPSCMATQQAGLAARKGSQAVPLCLGGCGGVGERGRGSCGVWVHAQGHECWRLANPKAPFHPPSCMATQQAGLAARKGSQAVSLCLGGCGGVGERAGVSCGGWVHAQGHECCGSPIQGPVPPSFLHGHTPGRPRRTQGQSGSVSLFGGCGGVGECAGVSCGGWMHAQGHEAP